MHRADEYHHCPACNRRTRHRVARERVLAPVMWCHECFHMWLAEDSRTHPGRRSPPASAP